MGNFAENLNLGNRFRPSPPPRCEYHRPLSAIKLDKLKK